MTFKNPLLTIIIPCYNEKNTIREIINLILNQKISKQIILVDDASTDGTSEIIQENLLKKIDKYILHKKNLGKGAAIKSAIPFILGSITIIQDADLEYDPNDYNNLIKPIVDGRADVVYGSRVLNKKNYENNRSLKKLYRILGNFFLTKISNVLNSQKLTDAHTCYKVIDSDLLKSISLEENGFSFCPELTTKISNSKKNIIEVPISYYGRDYSEGKKIKLIDFFIAIKTLIKFKFFKN